ncbi:MAG: spondin domain-containing protein [Chloroflexota bacterium]|nr:spondin domain-containing protein [Chloroflexota bacterium]
MLPSETPVKPTSTLPAITAVPTETPAPSAQYQLTFEATWSDATHPIDFPPNPHFSGLIGAAHSSAAHLWQEGERATPGIKNMAELGAKSPLDKEIDSLVAAGSACAKISGGGINPSPGVVTLTFTVNQECPLVSVVSMIAPSPDWFVGVSGLSLYEDGKWVDEKVVQLLPYDAGTDSGASYRSPDMPTEDAEAIYAIMVEPFLINGVVPSLGTFTFTRLDG